MMPTYDYRCTGGHTFSLLRPMSEAGNAAECPDCGKLAERILSASLSTVKGGTPTHHARSHR